MRSNINVQYVLKCIEDFLKCSHCITLFLVFRIKQYGCQSIMLIRYITSIGCFTRDAPVPVNPSLR